MENQTFHQAQFTTADPISEEFPVGSNHSFTRKNRGKRTEIIDEEAKKLDDEFWNNNPLFAQEHDRVDSMEVLDALDFPNREENHKEEEAHSVHEDNGANNPEEIPPYEDEEENGGEKEGIEEEQDQGEDDDGGDDDEEYEQIDSSGEEIVMSPDDEEAEKNSQKDGENVNRMGEHDPEKDKEDVITDLFVKNRENHLFYRPVFLKLDLIDCEKQDFSYIKLPPESHLPVGYNETKISRDNINNKYIGVPPKAPEEFRLPMYFPTMYNREMFKCEDERYMIDLNLIKYKNIIKSLENIFVLEDEEEKRQQFRDILARNKVIKKKYDLDESEDELEKLRNIINEFQHDLESLHKRRAYSDITTKKKKELYYPLAVRDYEFHYAANERLLLSNTKLVDEMSRNYLKVPIKRLNSPLTEDIPDYQSFYDVYRKIFYENDLHKILFSGTEFSAVFDGLIQELFVSYRASLYSILPCGLLYISNKELFNKAVQLALYSVRNSSYFDTETMPARLISLIQTYFGFDIEEEGAHFDVDSQDFQQILEELVKYENFRPQDFMAPFQNDDLMKNFTLKEPAMAPEPADIKPNFTSSFNLFLPHERDKGGVSYGTHFFYFIVKYFYIIYLKFLLAHNLSAQQTHLDSPQSTFDIFLNLTASYILDKINNSRYELAIINLFGSNAKYLLNIKSILAQITKGLISLIDDTVSFELMEKILAKKALNEPEKELLDFTCEFINTNDEIDNTENFVYRFHLEPSKGWFLTSVFDVKGVFMRALKTTYKAPSNNATGVSPKVISIKRNAKTSNGSGERVREDQTESLLGKRQERESEKIEGPVGEEDPDPLKKVHVD